MIAEHSGQSIKVGLVDSNHLVIVGYVCLQHRRQAGLRAVICIQEADPQDLRKRVASTECIYTFTVIEVDYTLTDVLSRMTKVSALC